MSGRYNSAIYRPTSEYGETAITRAGSKELPRGDGPALSAYQRTESGIDTSKNPRPYASRIPLACDGLRTLSPCLGDMASRS